MTSFLLAGAVLLVALFVLAVVRRGLIDGLAKRKLSNWKRASEAWALTDNDEIKPVKVCDGASTRRPPGVVGDHTDSDVPRPLSSRGRLPGAGNSVSGDLSHEPGCVKDDTRASSQCASPLPMVQREIELRALLDAAMETGRRYPEQCPIWIHPHQADRDGQEIRN